MQGRNVSEKSNEHPTVTQTKHLIRQRPRALTYEVLAERCDVSVSWIRDLLAGNIKDPSANKILSVRDFLIANQAATE
jgi:hypothetical protein